MGEAEFFSRTPSPPGIPAAPAGLTARRGNAQVGLSWTASTGAANYNVKRGTVSGGPYINIANRTATVHMDSGLSAGSYYYVVTAGNGGGRGTLPPRKNPTPLLSLPPPPPPS